MKIKTSELTGAALDWAVVKCEGIERIDQLGGAWIEDPSDPYFNIRYQPSTDWSQGGPIMEREKLDFEWVAADRCRAKYEWLDEPFAEGFGPTPLIAAMRCYVTIKLGDEVDVPEEILL